MKNLQSEMGAEKITLNLGAVELGRIDILVENAYYADRSEFIREAVRNKLQNHDADIERLTQAEPFADDKTKKSVTIGVLSLNKRDVEAMRRKGVKYVFVVVGLLRFDGLTAEDIGLALDVFETIIVYGSFIADGGFKAALEDGGILRTRKRRGGRETGE